MSRKDIHSKVLAALFIIVPNWKQFKCVSTDKQITNCAVKRSKPLIDPTTWINLKNIVLSERSQTQKSTVAESKAVDA